MPMECRRMATTERWADNVVTYCAKDRHRLLTLRLATEFFYSFCGENAS
jgi:hypothetical protein